MEKNEKAGRSFHEYCSTLPSACPDQELAEYEEKEAGKAGTREDELSRGEKR